MAEVIRPPDEMAGTKENFQKILNALEPWKCCGAPNLCNVTCQENELTAALALAHTLVLREIVRME